MEKTDNLNKLQLSELHGLFGFYAPDFVFDNLYSAATCILAPVAETELDPAGSETRYLHS